MEQLHKLLSQVKQCVDKDKQIRDEKVKRGENFNIFNILRLRTKETRTHSAFLAELLNPNGSHGCGSGFLSEFLSMFTDTTFEDDELANAKVFPEHFIGPKNVDETEGGCIDIAIFIGKFLLIIENKIYAVDQKNQLLRYANYAKALEKEKSITQYKLLYLTLNGNGASDFSTSRELIEEGKDYFAISYAKDILSWLNVCKSIAVEKPLVRETIIQYIPLIKELTNQDMDTKQQEQMFAIMSEYPEAIAGIFHAGFHAFRDYVFEHYCSPYFKEKAEELGLEYDPENILSGEKKISFSFKKPEWNYCKISIQTEKDGQDFCIGISFDGRKAEEMGKKVSPLQLNYLTEKRDERWPFGWRKFDKYKNWQSSAIIPALRKKEDGYCGYIIDMVKEILDEIKCRNIELV